MWNGFHDMNGWGWLMMAFGVVFWIALVAFVVWAIAHVPSRAGGTTQGPTAREVLDLRLARGEIDLDEHTRVSDALGRGKESR